MNLFSNQYEDYFDMFNYYNLITKINAGYKLCFDKINKCFVVINSAKNNQICLKFNTFSFNLIEKLQKSRVENSRKLFNEIDKNNEDLRLKKENFLKDELTQKTSDLINFSRRVSYISNSDTKKIIEGRHA
jgi:hypothetical protein